mmetsp:Transcript_123594/g.357448  ORF Transcript_123594/g.357448 Transcript_123594/m.357448 type:complete len:239 (+) Transcript_123594:896-1612(+)
MRCRTAWTSRSSWTSCIGRTPRPLGKKSSHPAAASPGGDLPSEPLHRSARLAPGSAPGPVARGQGRARPTAAAVSAVSASPAEAMPTMTGPWAVRGEWMPGFRCRGHPPPWCRSRASTIPVARASPLRRGGPTAGGGRRPKAPTMATPTPRYPSALCSERSPRATGSSTRTMTTPSGRSPMPADRRLARQRPVGTWARTRRWMRGPLLRRPRPAAAVGGSRGSRRRPRRSRRHPRSRR